MGACANVLAGSFWLMAGLALTGAEARADPVRLGASGHLFQLDAEARSRTLEAMRAAGLGLVRTDAHWARAETRPGEYSFPKAWDQAVDEAVSLGIEPLLIVDYGNELYDGGQKPVSEAARKAYADYARALALHFRGRVKYFEVWNEWDTRTGATRPGAVADYAALLREAYPAIKAAAPEAVVIAGAFSNAAINRAVGGGPENDLADFIATGAADAHSDAISIHVYPTQAGARLPLDAYRERFRASVEIIRARPALADKPILVTETGASTNKTPRGFPEDRQWDYISAGIAESERLGIDIVILYDLRDSGKGMFGLLRRDWSPKPAFEVLRAGGGRG